MLSLLFGVLTALAITPGADLPEGFSVSPAESGPQGLRIHTVQSPWQSQPTLLKILMPEDLGPNERCRVLYVLPVEAGQTTQWGEPLAEVKRLDLPGRHRLICVLPTFAQLPWYADHPDDSGVRQESHLVHGVVPWVDRNYPVQPGREGRLLVGFSKSGWGAFCLLLRHPDLFDRAAAWDSPLMQSTPTRFGMGPIFGTQQNFEAYRIDKLLERRAAELAGPPRLILLGYGNFQEATVAAHQRMVDLAIPHRYHNEPFRKHCWNSGWLEEAVNLLTSPAAP